MGIPSVLQFQWQKDDAYFVIMFGDFLLYVEQPLTISPYPKTVFGISIQATLAVCKQLLKIDKLKIDKKFNKSKLEISFLQLLVLYIGTNPSKTVIYHKSVDPANNTNGRKVTG